MEEGVNWMNCEIRGTILRQDTSESLPLGETQGYIYDLYNYDLFP